MNYEAILSAEGLAPLDSDGMLCGNRGSATRTRSPGAADAVDIWQSWALAVLSGTKFSSERHRHIWRLYATGKTYSQIQAAVGGSRRSVSWAIALVESTAPPKPCGNPWRQDSRGHTPAADPRIAWYDARRKRRRARRGEIEDESMAVNPIVRYSRILLKRGDEVEIKGRRGSADLRNVDGRAVIGGIEVYGRWVKGAGHQDQHEQFAEAILVPWWRIQQAERELTEDAK